MVQGQYPIISHGLGKLTPDVWKRLMDMLRLYEQKNLDERAKAEGGGTNFFLAKLTGAKNVKADSNRYIYSWTKVTISGVHANGYLEFTVTATTSTVDGDTFAKGAYNIIESVNTDDETSTGVNESAGTFPSGYFLQSIGGGYEDTLGDEVVDRLLETVVMVFRSGGKYLFSATNSYDGSC